MGTFFYFFGRKSKLANTLRPFFKNNMVGKLQRFIVKLKIFSLILKRALNQKCFLWSKIIFSSSKNIQVIIIIFLKVPYDKSIFGTESMTQILPS